MHWFLFLLLLITTILIFYQDLSTRSVIWFLFPLIAVLGAANTYFQTGSWTSTLINSVINAGFLLVQFVLLKTFYWAKAIGSAGIVNERLGLGDILFLLASCFFFSPFNFLIFYCSSLLFALTAHLLFVNIYKGKKYAPTVPLAGWMAVFLILYITAFSITQINPATDEWIWSYFIEV